MTTKTPRVQVRKRGLNSDRRKGTYSSHTIAMLGAGIAHWAAFYVSMHADGAEDIGYLKMCRETIGAECDHLRTLISQTGEDGYFETVIDELAEAEAMMDAYIAKAAS